MKIIKSAIIFVISLSFIATMVIFEIKSWPAGSSIAGLLLGFSLPALFHSIQDVLDTTDWKMSQRKLKRGGFISDNTIIRISFAYLYRIKIGDKYLLVKNERGTGKYQPVGGVYKFEEDEKIELKNRFQVKDDNKISIDESSRNDYRLRMENKYLRKFISHFDKKANRENVDNLSREFREELIEKNIINWNEISYRFCGRHMTNLHFGEHFQIYEILLADVVELLPTVEQMEDLKMLLNKSSDKYRLATAEEITSLGVNTATGQLREEIADHTRRILQENEGELIKTLDVGKIYTVNI
ncbi:MULTISPECIES: hypothetical protein [unclassified Parvimonas]|uniref:SMODS-associated NUDIX domain-containing protein n=1 Tax=unclassified Parvimonas TaxID=1151464 RepID=UPI002B485B40|nr:MULTISPECIES: hypothetical protein [unclassified Parvimonas]MEB3024721.1 hypothetical protein [Parvimonas sp. M13]MEB3088866.1 hypothetical protein [Parvimonas sp. M20]